MTEGRGFCVLGVVNEHVYPRLRLENFRELGNWRECVSRETGTAFVSALCVGRVPLSRRRNTVEAVPYQDSGKDLVYSARDDL